MKFTLVIYTILISVITNGQTSNSKAIKLWDAVDTLNWDDFNGLDDGSNYAAYISWEIRSNIIDTSHFEIFACIEKKKSWWRMPGRHLLRHEQYHFNIAEIFARLIRKTVIEKKLKPNSLNFDNCINSFMSQCLEMEKQYDLTTEHSENSEAQITWETYIDKQLKKFESYKSAIITL